MPQTAAQPCPCGSGSPYSHCCQRLIIGQSEAATAEQLMRSRFSAYAVQAVDYLLNTWAPDQQKALKRTEVAAWARDSQWLALDIIQCQKGQATDSEGWVEFIAHYRHQGKALQHRERSYFRRLQGSWFYVEGKVGDTVAENVKTGRNQPCPCNSGKKFKHCCGR